MREHVSRRLVSRLVPVGDCLEFTGSRDGNGYGTIRLDGRMQRTHRVAWELAHGPIPTGMCVMHACDNPPCCRVEHLRLGTVAENNADRAAKGRSRGVFIAGPSHPAKLRRGEQHWCAKLSATDVESIRARFASGESQTSIANDFHVHSSTVSRIVRRIWRQEVA